LCSEILLKFWGVDQPAPERRATADGNVDVLNAPGDHYWYFDATQPAEFLYSCDQETVGYDLPREVAYLESYDRLPGRVQTLFDTPNNRLDLLGNV
jgi:hypothetical protein